MGGLDPLNPPPLAAPLYLPFFKDHPVTPVKTERQEKSIQPRPRIAALNLKPLPTEPVEKFIWESRTMMPDVIATRAKVFHFYIKIIVFTLMRAYFI